MRCLWLLILTICAQAQDQKLKKQFNVEDEPRKMSASDLAELGDPLFLLVLKSAPETTKLDDIERKLLGSTGQRHLFVVHEEIMDPTPGRDRRSVTAYSGSNNGIRLDSNVMLSAELNNEGFLPATIEAWGWDDKRGRYNFYKLDRHADEKALTWKFRGSSVDADKMAVDDRDGTCMACHINGGPVMKELFLPWSNWHSPRSPASYLDATNPSRWAIAATPSFTRLESAENLEAFILPAIRKSNGRRVDDRIRRNAKGQPVTSGGMQEITDGPRTLRSLFGTTEYNIVSAQQLSGLHPFPAAGTGPAASVQVPDSFFLNANLLAGGGDTQYTGVGVAEAREFRKLLELTPEEYRAVVAQLQTKLGILSGDANFAWITPVPSHMDNHMVDTLIRRGVITSSFAAAVLAMDIETPVFSTVTPELLKYVPDKFQFKPGAAHPDALTKSVIARIRSASPPAGSMQAEFLSLLEAPQPVEILKTKVKEYLDKLRARLSNPAQRGPEIERLYRRLLDRRQLALDHPLLRPLVESDKLFPTGLE